MNRIGRTTSAYTALAITPLARQALAIAIHKGIHFLMGASMLGPESNTSACSPMQARSWLPTPARGEDAQNRTTHRERAPTLARHAQGRAPGFLWSQGWTYANADPADKLADLACRPLTREAIAFATA